MLDAKSKRLWFARYAASECNWARAVVMEKLARIEETEDKETHMWLTRAQTRDLYKSDAVGDAVCDECLNHPDQFEEHPTVPWMREAMMFYVPAPKTHKHRLRKILHLCKVTRNVLHVL